MRNLLVYVGVLSLGAAASCANQEAAGGNPGGGNDGTGNAQGGSGSGSNNGTQIGGASNGTGYNGGSSADGTQGGGGSNGSSQNGDGGTDNPQSTNGNLGGSGSTTSIGTTDLVVCTKVSGETKSGTAPPVIEFVLDNTNSMSDTSQPSTKGLSKWKALQNAFTSAIPTLAAQHPEYAIGLSYFHYRGYGPPGNPCTDALQAVEIAPLTSTQTSAVVSNVNAEGQIQMTPTQDIWQFSADHVLGWGTTDPTYAGSNRYVVVLTDGVPTVGPNCTSPGGCSATPGSSVTVAQYQPFIDVVGKYKSSRSLTTFMIAIPGAEAMNQVTCNDGSILYTPIDKMKEVATAGGTSLIDLTTSTTTDFTAALVDAITNQIAGSVTTVVGCNYTVPTPPTDPQGNIQFIDPSKVEVWYFNNGGAACSSDRDCGGGRCSPDTASNPKRCYSPIQRSAGCADVGGWDYTDSTNKVINLCSGACTTAQSDAGAKIEVLIGCFMVG